MNPIILVQARMGSSRLPGKVMMDICGKPMIQHVMEHCEEAIPHRVVLCLTHELEDEPLRAFARQQGWLYYAPQGVDPTHVGTRYYWAAQAAEGADPILRVTGDCPLIEPALIRWALTRYDGIFTATTPTERTGFPDGQDIEILPAKRAGLMLGEEHVTPAFHAGLVRYLQASDYGVEWPEGKWSVDTQKDLDRVREYLRRGVVVKDYEMPKS